MTSAERILIAGTRFGGKKAVGEESGQRKIWESNDFVVLFFLVLYFFKALVYISQFAKTEIFDLIQFQYSTSTCFRTQNVLRQICMLWVLLINSFIKSVLSMDPMIVGLFSYQPKQTCQRQERKDSGFIIHYYSLSKTKLFRFSSLVGKKCFTKRTVFYNVYSHSKQKHCRASWNGLRSLI